MLADLHKEIDTIKCKNRGAGHVEKILQTHQNNNQITELQFQLLLGSQAPGTSEESPHQHSSKGAAVAQIAEISPVEAEILGAEIKELQSCLHEARSRNVYLSTLIDKQKE